MAPKSERFEMRLDATLIERIDQWIAEHGGMSRAEAARALILHGLDKTSRHAVNISDGEKIIIAMLADQQRPPNLREINVDNILNAIFGGHYWALKWELSGLLNDHVDDAGALSIVVDTLEIWDFIESAIETFSEIEIQKIDKEAGPHGKNRKFIGFDGNNEGTERAIALHLIEDMGRFQRFKGRNLNSHTLSKLTYAKMIRQFQPIREALFRRVPMKLTVDEVITLLKIE
jgi:uncharacterized protein